MAKHWIQGAIKHPGIEKARAKSAGESTHAYMEQHKHSPGKAGSEARLGLRLEAMHRAKGGPVGPKKEHDKHHHVNHHSKIDHHPGRGKGDFGGNAGMSRAAPAEGPPPGFEQAAPQVSGVPMDTGAPSSPI